MAIGFGVEGARYEREVKKVLRSLTAKTDVKVTPDGTSAFNNSAGDLQIKFHNMKIDIEVKMSSRAQMGGSAINYMDGMFYFPPSANETLDAEAKDLIMQRWDQLEGPLEKFLHFLRKQEPKGYHEQKAMGLPLRCSIEAWKEAQTKGYLRPLNLNVSYSASFIHKYYATKKIDYMQIGKAGLFYLQKNPLNLPIPQLDGNIDIELRLARGGPAWNKEYSIETVGANVRAQARLKTTNKSPYSLDNPDNVLALFNK